MGGLKTEQKNTASDINNETEAFNKNLVKVTEFVKSTEKTPEKSNEVVALLNLNFQAWLKKLYETAPGKKSVDELKKQAENTITANKDKVDENYALLAVINVITPLTLETSSTKFEQNDASKLVKTDGTTDEKYNTTEKGKGFLEGAINKINGAAYTDLPGRAQILAALNNPKQENIASLQDFLYTRIPAEKANLLAAKSWQGTDGKLTGKRDGRYGTNTDNALNAYLEKFSAFKANSTEKKVAETNANTIIMKNELTTMKATAKKDFETTQSKLIKSDYTETNRGNIIGARDKFTLDIGYAKTPDEVTKATKRASDMIASIKTIAGEKTEKKAEIAKETTKLVDLQKNPEYQKLPKSIKNKIEKALNLISKDTKVDAKTELTADEKAKVDEQIKTLQAQNKTNTARILEIDSDLTAMKNLPKSSKQSLKNEKTRLEKEIEKNNRIVDWSWFKAWLLSDSKTKALTLEGLKNTNGRIEDKLSNKLAKVNTLLQWEIEERGKVASTIKDQTTKEALAKEITTIQNVQTIINAIKA